MSCSFVDRNTIVRAIIAINAVPHLRVLDVTLNPSGQGIDAASASELGNKLWTLNRAAYVGRYGGIEEQHSAEVFSWTKQDAKLASTCPRGHRLSAVLYAPLLKSLQCLIYQLSEDPVYGSEDYKELRGIAADLATAIVEGLPEYAAAEWG